MERLFGKGNVAPVRGLDTPWFLTTYPKWDDPPSSPTTPNDRLLKNDSKKPLKFNSWTRVLVGKRPIFRGAVRFTEATEKPLPGGDAQHKMLVN